jgi:hypothetical protein
MITRFQGHSIKKERARQAPYHQYDLALEVTNPLQFKEREYCLHLLMVVPRKFSKNMGAWTQNCVHFCKITHYH